jgi:hypothetical protein
MLEWQYSVSISDRGYIVRGLIQTALAGITADIISLFRILYRKNFCLSFDRLLGIQTLKRIAFVPNVVLSYT